MAYLQRLQPTLDGVKKTAGRGLVVLGAGAVLSSLAMAAARWQASRADKRHPEEFVIEIDLTDLKLVETMPTNPLELLQGAPGKQLELRKVVHALEVAGKDPRVRGVLAKLGSRDRLGGMATIQELRSAIQSYRTLADARGGAPAVAFSAAFGEAGSNGTMEYYLASGFDKVYMQSSGSLGLLGLQSQMLFFKDLLDRLKVKPIVYTREKFKTALHMFTQEGFTPEHKENVQSILKSLTHQMWSGIASSRGLTLDQVQSAVRAAPLMPDAAITQPTGALEQQPQGYGLIDGIKYIDQVVSGLVKSPKLLSIERTKASKGSKGGKDDLVDPKLPRIPISKYILVKDLVDAAGVAPAGGWLGDTPWAGLWPGAWATASQNKDGFTPGAARTAESAGWVSPSVGRGRPKLAIITATGAIVQGPVRPGGPPGGKMIDATKLAAQLNRLAEARDVKAVVLRVSSPGGSALGSDTLHHALINLKESGKTLVVSLGDVAASGGMFMAVAGDRIIAQPGTITGSIGVVVGKPDATGLLTENGINPDSIEEGSPNLTLFSPLHGINQEQEVTINAMMDHIYDDFLQKVATGRKMSVEAVRGLAGGKVYTGEQALEVGLVDELGGLKDALEAAKKLAGLPAEEGKVVVFDYPPRKVSFLVRLLQSMGPSLTPEQLGQASSSSSFPGGPLTALAGAWAASRGVGAWAVGAGAAHHPLTALMEGVATSAQVRRVLGAVGEVVQTAGQLDGVVSVYAADAQLLAETLA